MMFISGHFDPNRHNSKPWGIYVNMVLARHPFLSAVRIPVANLMDRRTLLSAVGIAALSAAAMFMSFLLAEQNSPSSGISRQTVSAPVTPIAGTGEKTVSQASGQTEVKPAADVSHAQPINFTLIRSRHSEKIGPFSVRLLRTDTRRGACNVMVVDEQGKIRYHRLRTKEPVRLRNGDASATTEITVTKVSRDRIQGVLVPLELTSVSYRAQPRSMSLAVRG